MTADDSLIPGLGEARQHFLELVDEVRPELHRYCARMVGSVADGEDIVQDTLARAWVRSKSCLRFARGSFASLTTARST
jgi:DNA-directed RNA polymerase specialized sigma24 family protein